MQEGRARLNLRQEPGGPGAPGRRAGRCDRQRREPRQVLGPSPEDRRVRPGGGGPQAGRRRAGRRRECWRLGAGPEGVVPPAGGRREAPSSRLSRGRLAASTARRDERA
uniref:Uncharacterized protein n=1 Tax=Arundo donax TaxID=35708 RepID=A0A0A9FWV4_ARUDO